MIRNKGFSLVEVIMVIALLGLIATIGVFNTGGITNRSDVKSDILTGQQIGKAFLLREMDGLEISVGEQIEYTNFANISKYVSADYKPEAIDNGCYVITKVEVDENTYLMVGISNGSPIESSTIYDGKNPGWVWCQAGNIENFFERNNIDFEKDMVTECIHPNYGIRYSQKDEINHIVIKTCTSCEKITRENEVHNSPCEKCGYSKIINSEITYAYVTYNANGGTGTMEVQKLVNGISNKLVANAFTKTGYTFSGWSTSKNGSIEYLDSGTLIPSGDVTLYAVWNLITTTYDCPCPGCNNPVSSQSTYCDTCYNDCDSCWRCSYHYNIHSCGKCKAEHCTCSSGNSNSSEYVETPTPTSTSTQTPTPSHTHSYEIKVAATCTSEGKKECECGAYIILSTINHSWGSIKPATCTSSGTEKCSNCSATRTISQLDHPYWATGICSVCGDPNGPNTVPHETMTCCRKPSFIGANAYLTECNWCGSSEQVHDIGYCGNCNTNGQAHTCASCGGSQYDMGIY